MQASTLCYRTIQKASMRAMAMALKDLCSVCLTGMSRAGLYSSQMELADSTIFARL